MKEDLIRFNDKHDFGTSVFKLVSQDKDDNIEGTHDDTGHAWLIIQRTGGTNNWNILSGPCEMRTTGTHIQYHYPEKDKEKTEHTKTFTAQRGIAIRVKVPSELWAGEKQPLFAVLNGKHGSNGAETGDMHYSFPFRWETSDPIIEFDANGMPTEVHAPENDEEVLQSIAATANHKIKCNTSPLYLGDIATFSSGLVYVRAVAENVPLVTGEYVDPDNPNAVLTTFKSDWFEINIKEDIYIVAQNGYSTEKLPLYDPEEFPGLPIYKNHDYSEDICISFDDSLSSSIEDIIHILLRGTNYDLTETTSSSKVFHNEDDSFIITINSSDFINPAQIDSLNVTVYNEEYDIDNETFDMKESGIDTKIFQKVVYHVELAFGHALSSEIIDHLTIYAYSTHSEDEIDLRLTETDIDTNIFIDESGNNSVEITSLSGMEPNNIDTMSISFAPL